MGLGFRLNLKWGLSIQPRSSSNSSRVPSSYSCSKSRDVNYDIARVSLPSVLSMESEASYNDTRRASTCSSACQLLENNYSETEDIKMSMDKKLRAGLQDEKLTFLTSLQENKISEYSLLLENLVVLEDTFADSDVATLERDIMVQLERLGALRLFHASPSKTIEFPSSAKPINDDIAKPINDDIAKPINYDIAKPVVPSTQKEKRKIRRERASRKAKDICIVEFPSKATDRKNSRLDNFPARRSSKLRGRRLKITRDEAELSRGVKLVTNLERLRMKLEEETGTAVCFGSWAAASGLDKNVLLENLQFGWRCKDELLRSTRSLVVYLARSYLGRGMPFEDLIQAGNLGVLQAAARFDQSKGYKFSTYAQHWIRKSMSMLLSRHARGIRYTLSKAIKQIEKAKKFLYSSYGKFPDDEEIAKLTGLSLEKIASASKCLRVVGSIDQETEHSISTKSLEVFPPDAAAESPEESFLRQLRIKEMFDLMKCLDAKERKVIVLRYGLEGYQETTLEEIGSLFGVTKEWIRRLQKKALTKLKLKDEETQRLMDYVYI